MGVTTVRDLAIPKPASGKIRAEAIESSERGDSLARRRYQQGCITTRRAQHPNAPSVVPVHSLAQLVAYDAFHLTEQLLTQPLRLIAGSRAGSLWFSQDAFRRAGSRDKSLHIVEDATHVAMYDTPKHVQEAMAQLVPLYQNAGKASSASNFVGPLSAHPAGDVAASP